MLNNMVTTSIIIAAVIYAAYNAVALAFFGVPESLSNTYYLYQAKCNKGWLFCAMMYLVVAFMMPAWITMSEGSDFQFLSFLAPVGIMFVGTAPRFKDSMMENRVHSVSAIVAAICSLLWVGLVTPYSWVILAWAGLVALISWLTKTWKSGLVYWLETVAFGATFTSTIIK
jgi:hypothetical protein